MKVKEISLLVMALVLSGCGSNVKKNEEENVSATPTAVPDVWDSYDTLEAAEKYGGMKLNDPGFSGYDRLEYRVNQKRKIIEVCYEYPHDDTAVIRKGNGILDVSDVDEKFDATDNGKQNGHDIFLSEKDDLTRLAIWTDGTNSYSLYVSAGMKEADFLKVTSQIR